MKCQIRTIAYTFILSILLISCGGSSGVLSTPIENIDSSPIKVSKLTESELNTWSHRDLLNDTIPGMSVDKAYKKIIKGKKGEPVIVAVIDSGIDIDHEDLDDVLWTNTDEIPNNGKDDDNNGYVDDIHGWNFVGEGYNEQLEFVRLLASGDTSNPRFKEAESEYTKEFQKYSGYKTQYDQIFQQVSNADNAVAKALGKNEYTLEDVNGIQTQDQSLQQSVAIVKYVYSLDAKSVPSFLEEIESGLIEINDMLNYHLNKSLNGRKTGDNPDDLNDNFGYGNNNPRPVSENESHGTHVTGIIAAERNNNLGINGVANNVQIMAIRSTPNGDEYDKDVANAIRYAADNGAKVINGSFGKSYSPHSEWVRDAIKYAADKDVLIVMSAGNDSKNVDVSPSFPNDAIGTGPEVSDNFLLVGSITHDYGSDMVSSFSNYGKINVDVFAPGSEIYSSLPNNDYGLKGGTSMAAPNVAGVAALIRSQYPNLSASQVKRIIMDSGLPIKAKVTVGENKEVKSFSDISRSGKIVNAYNALILASQIANSK